MATRRTRSLNELPGHLRVPILRRKDTQRTKDRLAAGLAGMEELKSLRQHQQQIVGETVAKAEDKLRHERHQGGERCLADDAGAGLRQSCATSLGSVQAIHSPRHITPYPRSLFRGQSMDMISEEGDGLTNSNGHHCDLNNNNNNNSNKNHTTRDTNKSARDQFSHDGSNHDCHPRPPNTQTTTPSPNGLIPNSGDTNTRTPGCIETPQENQRGPNPNGYRNGNDTSTQLKQSQNHSDGQPVLVASTPSRRGVMSPRPSNPTPSTPSRQRSMSLDMGHGDIKPFQISRQPLLWKNGNLHNKFSSLTSINADVDDRGDAPQEEKVSLRANDRHKLSQSMTQLQNAGCSRLPPASSSLKRRGSLTWDSLLKSRGIQNATTPDSTPPNNQLQNDHNNDTPDGDDVFSPEIVQREESSNILLNRRKGRSMSFTCGNNNSSHLINQANPCLDLSQQNSSSDFDPSKVVAEKSSPHTTTPPSQSIHPILRRASIQCEAVLTHSKRVVNPIQDVDVKSFNNPGPLHAVMLQYRGYRPSRTKAEIDESIQTANKTITHASGTEAVLNECSPCRLNAVRHPFSQTTKNSPGLSSSHLGSDEGSKGVIPPESAVPRHQDKPCLNVTQDTKNALSMDASGHERMSACISNDDEKRSGVDKDMDNKLGNVNMEGSSPTVPPRLAKECEKTLLTNCSESLESESMPGVATLCQSTLDENNRDSHRSHVENSSAVYDSGVSSYSIKRETKKEREYPVKSDNPSETSSYSDEMPHYEGRDFQKRNLKSLQNSDTAQNNQRIESYKSNETRGDDDKYKAKGDEIKDSEVNGIHLCHDPNNSADVSHKNYLISTWRSNEHQDSRFDIMENGYPSNNSSARVLDNDGAQRVSGGQSQTHQIFIQHSMDEADAIRNKRSSIFSDVSLISDSSSKTPSSSASVFSDVSMISDEGYESVSAESKMAALRRLNSVFKGNPVPFSDASHRFPKLPDECVNNSVFQHQKSSSGRDNNGNDVINHGESPSYNFEENPVRDFGYGKETTFEHTDDPVVVTRPSQGQRTNQNQHKTYRKPLKQTTV